MLIRKSTSKEAFRTGLESHHVLHSTVTYIIINCDLLHLLLQLDCSFYDVNWRHALQLHKSQTAINFLFTHASGRASADVPLPSLQLASAKCCGKTTIAGRVIARDNEVSNVPEKPFIELWPAVIVNDLIKSATRRCLIRQETEAQCGENVCDNSTPWKSSMEVKTRQQLSYK